MAGKLLIDAHHSDETRIAIIGEDGKLENFEAEYSDRKPIKGNIYLAKVVRIEPSIQAAFIDYGDEKNGFLPLSEIHHDYFNQNVLKSIEEETSSEGSESGDTKHPKRQVKIQEVISNKQIILVQAEKEIRGNKCAFFTTFISLPGRYCVLVPNPPKGKGNAISKKIDHSEKERLKGIIESLNVPEGMNCIIRTAGENRTKQEIKRDLEYLCRLWNEIRDKVTASVAPTLIHEESNIIKRGIRDLYQRTMDKIIVQGKSAYKESRAFMKTFTPSHVKKIELYDDSEAPLFHKYEIEDKIDKILDPMVILPSGGSIVINTTEALTAIDVNSGKSKNERDIEETALKTNLEAAVEIGRQIKLRDIAGIIVIDFIDMIDHKSQSKVEKAMRDAMKDDYSSIQFGKLSQFGLMELSRQRLRTSLADATFIQCSHCAGSGKILANETVALSVMRKIENFLVQKTAKSVVIEVAPGIDLFILNHKRQLLSEMEHNYEVAIEITRNAALSAMNCKFIVKEYNVNDLLNKKLTSKTPDKVAETEKKGKKQSNSDSKIEELVKSEDSESSSTENRKKKKKRKNRKKSAPTDAQPINQQPQSENQMSPETTEEVAKEQGNNKRKRRRKKKPATSEEFNNSADNVSEQKTARQSQSESRKQSETAKEVEMQSEQGTTKRKRRRKKRPATSEELNNSADKASEQKTARQSQSESQKQSETARESETQSEQGTTKRKHHRKKKPVASETPNGSSEVAPNITNEKKGWLRKIFT